MPAALDGADVVLLATTSRTPIITDIAQIPPGAHVTSSGVDMVGRREVGPDVVRDADVVVLDDRELVIRVGLRQPVDRAGEDRPTVTVGDLLTGAPGRTDDDQRTLAGLVGLGVQDAAILAAVLARLDSAPTARPGPELTLEPPR